jgi:uncharacterized protein YndB with AHSA1/START domain
MADHVATASTRIDAPAAQVWQALTDPAQIREYMFGAEVVTDWTPGGPIVWKGVQDGREYQDKGQVLEVEPGQRLVMTHYSPLSGQDDVPENYHTLAYELRPDGSSTEVVLNQDNNPSEEAARHSAAMWEQMLGGLKQYVEG